MYGFIVNRASGKGNKVWKKVEGILIKEKRDYLVRFTNGPQHATQVAQELATYQLQAIVVIGGDGTVNEVANGLVDSDIPLGVIPAGSGNDFARCLGIPLDYKKALLRIFDQQYKKVDLLQLEKRYCLTVTGFGFDGKVAQTTNKAKYNLWLNQVGLGSLSYVFSMLNVLRNYQPTSITLKVDTEELSFSDVWLVAVANSPNYAGGVRICPQAVHDDGELNICIVHGLSKWNLLLLFIRAYKGTHINHRNVQLLKGKEVFIQTKEPVSVHSDGEIVLDSPAHLEIKKGALNVV